MAVHVVGTILLDGAKELTAEISELTKLVTTLVTEAASDDTAEELSKVDVAASDEAAEANELSVAVAEKDPDSDDNAVPVV